MGHPGPARLLEEVLPQNTSFEGFEVTHDFESVGQKVMLVNARRIYREQNKTQFILLAFEDITERRRAEHELAIRHEWQRVTLRSIGDVLIATDMAGRVTLLNPVAEELTGWATDEATGLPLEQVFQIINEESRQPVEHPVAKVLREGHVVGLANHTLLIHRDGSERSIDDSAAPIRDSDGEISGVVLIFRDITERRRAERAVSDALDYANNIVETVREPMLVLDGRPAGADGQPLVLPDLPGRAGRDGGPTGLRPGRPASGTFPALRKLLEEILPQNTSFDDFEVEHDFAAIGRKVMLLNARRI